MIGRPVPAVVNCVAGPGVVLFCFCPLPGVLLLYGLFDMVAFFVFWCGCESSTVKGVNLFL